MPAYIVSSALQIDSRSPPNWKFSGARLLNSSSPTSLRSSAMPSVRFSTRDASESNSSHGANLFLIRAIDCAMQDFSHIIAVSIVFETMYETCCRNACRKCPCVSSKLARFKLLSVPCSGGYTSDREAYCTPTWNPFVGCTNPMFPTCSLPIGVWLFKRYEVGNELESDGSSGYEKVAVGNRAEYQDD